MGSTLVSFVIYAECRNKVHYAECRYAKCRSDVPNSVKLVIYRIVKRYQLMAISKILKSIYNYFIGD
jgi:hypothetical protein